MEHLVHPPSVAGLFLIFISATFTDNILLTRFLGMCSCLSVSKKVDTSIGLGAAVIFVTVCTAAIDYLVYKYLLLPFGLEYLKLATFIIIIAAFTQLVEMIVDRYSPALYNALGIFLPLIAVNCAILGISIFMLNKPYGFLETLIYGIGGGFGWFIAITLVGGIREKMNEAALPKGIAGAPITLIIIGIMSLAFIGFSGMVKV